MPDALSHVGSFPLYVLFLLSVSPPFILIFCEFSEQPRIMNEDWITKEQTGITMLVTTVN